MLFAIEEIINVQFNYILIFIMPSEKQCSESCKPTGSYLEGLPEKKKTTSEQLSVSHLRLESFDL